MISSLVFTLLSPSAIRKAPSLQVFQTVIQLVEGLHASAAAVGQFFVLAEFQQKALGQFFDRLLERRQKLRLGKVPGR